MDDSVKNQLANLRLRSQSDLHRMWSLLMRPLGFSSTAIWMTFVDRRDVPLPLLLQITECPHVITPDEVTTLYDMLGEMVAGDLGIESVAFLIARPGHGGLTAADRQFAQRLLAGAPRTRPWCRPVHVATDEAILAVSPDDLAA
jgi:hypothetical protein